MRPLRAITALLANLLLLNLVFVEAGFTCVVPSSAHAMAGMDMSAAEMAAMEDMPGMSMEDMAPQPERAPGRAPRGQSPGSDCGFPWAPAGCQSMVPCAPPTLGSAIQSAVTPPPPAHTQIARLDVLAPSSVLTPPDPPPPRV